MKNFYLKGIFLSSVISMSLLACKAKKENLETPITAKSLAGRYVLVTLTGETAFTPPTSIMDRLDECELDNVYELKADSTASYIDEGIICEPAKNYTLGYAIISNSVNLTGFQNPYFTGGTVTKFDGKTMVIEAKVLAPGNIQTTVVGTFKKP